MSNYQGLLVRSTFQDNGTIPATGNISGSPDIIPYQIGSLTWSQANSTYGGPDQGANVVGGQTNNVYVRAKNIAQAAMPGSVGLYAAASNLLLTPNQWNQIVSPGTGPTIAFVDQNGNTNIANNSVCLVQTPFIVQNLPKLASGAHYCLIALANNNNTPVPLPSNFTNNAAFAHWVAMHPNIAWRNIAYLPGTGNTFNSIQLFGNENAAPAFMAIIISGNVGANLAGVTYQALCSDSRLSSQFQSTGSFTAMADGSYTANFLMQVPASIGTAGSSSMSMAFTLTAPNGQLFPTATMTFRYLQVPSQTQEPYEDLMQQPYHMQTADETALEIASLILLGSNVYLVNS